MQIFEERKMIFEAILKKITKKNGFPGCFFPENGIG
jgi:hypothetical protein